MGARRPDYQSLAKTLGCKRSQAINAVEELAEARRLEHAEVARCIHAVMRWEPGLADSAVRIAETLGLRLDDVWACARRALAIAHGLDEARLTEATIDVLGRASSDRRRPRPGLRDWPEGSSCDSGDIEGVRPGELKRIRRLLGRAAKALGQAEIALEELRGAERRTASRFEVEAHPALLLLANELDDPSTFESALETILQLRMAMERAIPPKGVRADRELLQWHREAAGRADQVWRSSGRGEPTDRRDGQCSPFEAFGRRWLRLLGVKAVVTALRERVLVSAQERYATALASGTKPMETTG